MNENVSIRLLVLGDSGVGKTSVVNYLCTGLSQKATLWSGGPQPTVGCKIEVKLHNYKGQNYFIELWDVGGSKKYSLSRHIFYTQRDGLMLVHDLTNSKSYRNIHRWIVEATGADFKWREPSRESLLSSSEHSLELEAESPLPVLIIGTKLDLTDKKTQNDRGYASNQHDTMENMVSKHSVKISSTQDTNSALGDVNSSDAQAKINLFFDKVVARYLEKSKSTINIGSSMYTNNHSSSYMSSLYGSGRRNYLLGLADDNV